MVKKIKKASKKAKISAAVGAMMTIYFFYYLPPGTMAETIIAVFTTLIAGCLMAYVVYLLLKEISKK